MWISEKLQRERENTCISRGMVVTGGENLMISGDNQLVSPPVSHPYGVFSLMPQGETVVAADDTVIGVIGNPPVLLEEGEVCLYSKGGTIVLKNNGDVIINGKKLAV